MLNKKILLNEIDGSVLVLWYDTDYLLRGKFVIITLRNIFTKTSNINF